MWRTLIAVGTGGFAGSVLRFLVSRLLASYAGGGFPTATFAVNIAGCFILGILTGLTGRAQWLSPDMKALLATGFCGGLTTFSTFMGENFALARNGQVMLLAVYLIISLAVGFLMFMAGYLLSTKAEV